MVTFPDLEIFLLSRQDLRTLSRQLKFTCQHFSRGLAHPDYTYIATGDMGLGEISTFFLSMRILKTRQPTLHWNASDLVQSISLFALHSVFLAMCQLRKVQTIKA